MSNRVIYNTVEEIGAEIDAISAGRGGARLRLGYLLVRARLQLKAENGGHTHTLWGPFLRSRRIPETSARRYEKAANWLEETQNLQLEDLTDDAPVNRIDASLIDAMVDGVVDGVVDDVAIIARIFKTAERGHVGLDDVNAWEAGFDTVEKQDEHEAGLKFDADYEAAMAKNEGDGDEEGDGEEGDGDDERNEETKKAGTGKSSASKPDPVKLVQATTTYFKDFRKVSPVHFKAHADPDELIKTTDRLLKILNMMLPQNQKLSALSKPQIAAVKKFKLTEKKAAEAKAKDKAKKPKAKKLKAKKSKKVKPVGKKQKASSAIEGTEVAVKKNSFHTGLH